MNTQHDWEQGIEEFSALKGLGFKLFIEPDSTRMREARFLSSTFELRYSADLLTGDLTDAWFQFPSGEGMPDPVLAIFFFAENIEPIFSECVVGGLARLAQKICIYRSNKWVFDETEWLFDKEFRAALNSANEWAVRQFRPLVPWEFERFLWGLRAR